MVRPGITCGRAYKETRPDCSRTVGARTPGNDLLLFRVQADLISVFPCRFLPEASERCSSIWSDFIRRVRETPTSAPGSAVQFSYGQDNANHHLGCDSSPRRPCLLDLSAARPDGLVACRGANITRLRIWSPKRYLLNQLHSSINSVHHTGAFPFPGNPLLSPGPVPSLLPRPSSTELLRIR